MTSKMDFNLIKPFLAVYQTQSITKAAEQLDLTQPAVSAAIRRLEGIVSQTLFKKQGRGIVATSAANHLAQKFSSAAAIIESALQDKNKLHVYVAEPVMHQLTHCDELILHDSPADEAKILQDLDSQQVDLLIDIIQPQDSSYLVEHLYDESIVVVCRHDHPRIKGSISQQQFEDEQHIYYQPKRQLLNGLEYRVNASVDRNIRASVSSLGNIFLAVNGTDCIASCSRSIAEKWQTLSNIQVLDYPMPLPSLPVYLSYHKRLKENSLLQKLLPEIRGIGK